VNSTQAERGEGKTSTPLAKSHAEDLAKAVPGVQEVVDDVGTEK
jgi:osmotically-inducible protein OsmY